MLLLFDVELLLLLLLLLELELLFDDPLLDVLLVDELVPVEVPPFVVALFALFAVKCIFNVFHFLFTVDKVSGTFH